MKMHKAKDIANSLQKKGFKTEFSGSHQIFIFIFENKLTQIRTKLSMGSHSRDPGRDNLQKMKKDLKFDNYNDFSNLIDCPYTKDMYIAMLKRKGLL